MRGAWRLWEPLFSPPPEAQATRPRLDLHVVERAPAAVGVPRAQALAAGRVLLAGLHGHPGHLPRKHTQGLSAPRRRQAEQEQLRVLLRRFGSSNTTAIRK